MNPTIADEITEVLTYHAIEGECAKSIEETAKLCLDVSAETYGEDSDEYAAAARGWRAILASDQIDIIKSLQRQILSNWDRNGPICIDHHAELEANLHSEVWAALQA